MNLAGYPQTETEFEMSYSIHPHYTPSFFSAAHMAEKRHQQHEYAVNWRKMWHALNNTGFGLHQDAKEARARMRECILTARHYRAGQRHYASIANQGGAA